MRTSSWPIWLERDQAPVAAGQGEVGEPGGVEALGAGAAGDHIDGADVLAHLRDGDAGQQELQLLRRIGGRQADQPQAILVEDEVDGRRRARPSPG